jgi:hypothetical protein
MYYLMLERIVGNQEVIYSRVIEYLGSLAEIMLVYCILFCTPTLRRAW